MQHALCDLAFNLGIVQLLKFSKTLALLEAGDYQAASIELLDSNYARQLPQRSQRVSDQLAQGDGRSG
jgi:lysozyme